MSDRGPGAESSDMDGKLERLRKRSVTPKSPTDPAGHAGVFELAVSRFEEGASTIDVPGATPAYVHQGLVEVGDGAQRRRVLL